MRLTWLGHSTVLVETAGVRVLADPLLRARIGPLRRAVPLPPEAGLLPGRVDAVVLSHLHHDHCDLPSLHRLRAPVVVAPPGGAAWLARHGVGGATELPPGTGLPLPGGVTVTAVPALHPGRREPRGPDALAVGHVVEGPDGAAWLAGDTGLHPGMAELPGATRGGEITVAAIPVWGWGPTLGPGHLDPGQAADAVARAGARHAVPVHWGTLYPAGLRTRMATLLRTPGPDFARRLEDAACTAHVLPVGGSVTLP